MMALLYVVAKADTQSTSVSFHYRLAIRLMRAGLCFDMMGIPRGLVN